MAIELAEQSAQANNIANVQFLAGSSERIFELAKQQISTEERCRTAVVIDPPRKGCDDAFLRQLFDFGPRRLVYVSCDPATQARDAKIICQTGGYSILDVTPFDLFPQTRHIENVIVFDNSN